MMLNDLDDSLIYPKPDTIELPSHCNIIPVINPVMPLEFTLPENVISTLTTTYAMFGKKRRIDNRSVKTLCESPIYRIRNYDINFAKYLSDALATYLPAQLTFNERSRVDWESNNPEKYNVWNLIGISPYFRYVEYTSGSDSFPRYNRTYSSPTDPLTRTLMSGIIYLTDNEDGATAFIDDKQHHLPHRDRNLKAREYPATYDEIYEWSIPKRGNIIVFPHGECHSVLSTTETRKTIRFDVYYSAYSKK